MNNSQELKVTYHYCNKRHITRCKLPKDLTELLNQITSLINCVRGPKSPIRIYWLDQYGDEHIVMNNETFNEFMEKFPGYKHLQIRSLIENNDKLSTIFNCNKYIHENTLCAVCNQCPIIGFRYKCIECKDTNLCSNCESKGHHPFHIMLRLTEFNAKKEHVLNDLSIKYETKEFPKVINRIAENVNAASSSGTQNDKTEYEISAIELTSKSMESLNNIEHVNVKEICSHTKLASSSESIQIEKLSNVSKKNSTLLNKLNKKREVVTTTINANLPLRKRTRKLPNVAIIAESHLVPGINSTMLPPKPRSYTLKKVNDENKICNK